MPKKRAHSGHVNRGLPPTALYELYEKTPGDHLDRLLALGIVKPGPEFTPAQNVAHWQLPHTQPTASQGR